jgi:hypothetical protein
MDSGQPCNCGHCSGCDPEKHARESYEWMMNKANQVAKDDKLFNSEKDKYERFITSDFAKKEHDSGCISNITMHAGDVYIHAAIMRAEEEFYKKHGRYQTVSEFLLGIFPEENKE